MDFCQPGSFVLFKNYNENEDEDYCLGIVVKVVNGSAMSSYSIVNWASNLDLPNTLGYYQTKIGVSNYQAFLQGDWSGY